MIVHHLIRMNGLTTENFNNVTHVFIIVDTKQGIGSSYLFPAVSSDKLVMLLLKNSV